ncbi:MAG: dihydrolipoyl dehydrogenase [Pseudomonadota bacterium]
MSETLSCDVAVIGAGTAGLSAERAARSAGAQTLLIDPTFAGTTCALAGCMPSKLLIAASRAAHSARNAHDFGIAVADVDVDDAAVMKRVRDERNRFARLTREGSIADVPDNNRVKGHAHFVSDTRLELDSGQQIEAGSVVIATGSRPTMPDSFAALGDRAITSDDLFELRELPARIAVIGSGPIGMELAQALSRLGVATALFERSDRLAGIVCDTVHGAVEAMIRRDLTVNLGVETTPQRTDNGVMIAWKGATQGETEFDRVLVATGRTPNVERLALEATGLELNEGGVPVHNRETMQCGESQIFIAGDAADDIPILHEASHDGTIAGRNAAAAPVSLTTKRLVPFTLTFTDPPIARIGTTDGADSIVATADYSDQGRARVENANHGCATLYADKTKGTLIGAALCVPGGEHLAHMLAWAIESEATASDLLNMPIYHPTLEEGLEGALREICSGTPIAVREDRDRAEPAGV